MSAKGRAAIAGRGGVCVTSSECKVRRTPSPATAAPRMIPIGQRGTQNFDLIGNGRYTDGNDRKARTVAQLEFTH
jgi:hypothetical protein